MRCRSYILLTTPVRIKIVDDSESPEVQANILKILKYAGMDEYSPLGFIEMIYTYGFLNSKGEFVQLERQTHTEFICDIKPSVSKDGVPEGQGLRPSGLGPISRVAEPAGDWLTNLITPTVEQRDRSVGDFRIKDLYQYLIDKYEIAGEIITYV
jgi:hypothetical protein